MMLLDDIRTQEDRRCRAMVDRDMTALDEIFNDDMIHVHISGHVDDKASYMADTETKYLYHDMRRLTYSVRDYGDIALADGELFLELSVGDSPERHTARLVTSQVWVKSAQGWRQASYHASRID